METGHFSTAKRDFEKAVNLTQKDPLKQEKAYFARGLNCFKQGLYQEARVDFDTVLRLNQHNAEAKALRLLIASRDKKPIEKSLPEPKPIEIDEHASPTELVKTGYTLMQAGDNDSAIKFFARAIQRQPNNIEARRSLAYALLAYKRDVNAEPKSESNVLDKEKAAKTAQSSAERQNGALAQFAALEKMGVLTKQDIDKYVELLTAMGRRDKVVTVLQSFLKAHSDDLKARVELANTFVTLNKLKEFQKTCIEGMKLAKTNADYDVFRSLLTNTSKKIVPHAKTEPVAPSG
jgi:tetratricopeptide (TPR) repeat protein